ncbi:MAG: molybdopterin-dependent oxidoreductase, partial [Candidatus Bathyarchaeia archaeon]
MNVNINLDKGESIELLNFRKEIYSFFSSFFRQPPSRFLIDKLLKNQVSLLPESLSTAVTDEMRESLEYIRKFIERNSNIIEDKDIEALLDHLNIEFTRLFRGLRPSYSIPPPYETLYIYNLTPNDSLRVMYDILTYYKEANAKLTNECRERSDHISIELGFMQYLSEKLIQALEDEDEKRVIKYLEIGKRFLSRLKAWIPLFCEKAFYSTDVDLFKGVLLLLKEFIHVDFSFMNSTLEREENADIVSLLKYLGSLCRSLNVNDDPIFTEGKENAEGEIKIPTTCVMCYSCCGIIATVKDGLLIKLDGNPDAPPNQGKMCLKGLSSIMLLYDPYRVKAPLIRTNPEKGIGIDPKWKEISWEEAINIIVERLKKIREEDPMKLLWVVRSFSQHQMSAHLWPIAFGCSYLLPLTGYGSYCGNAEHALLENTRQSFMETGDLRYSNYIMIIGGGHGNIAGPGAMPNTRVIAERKEKGAKIIVVDPRMTEVAERADRWIPILPGTECAWLLGLCYVIIYEIGKYDVDHLKHETNAVYLIDSEGHFVRDKETGKVLIFDAADGKAKVFDDPSLKDPALIGEYEVNGVRCKPAFQCFIEIIKNYTPENVEKITTIPAAVTREVAKELVEHACIGSTIELDGKVYPYRPVSILVYSGFNGHSTSTYSVMALVALTHILGAIDAVGSNVAGNVGGLFGFGHPPHKLIPGKDGMNAPTPAVPPVTFKFPVSPDMGEYFPLGFEVCQVAAIGLSNPKKYGLKYKPEDLTVFVAGTNPLMNSINPYFMADLFKRFKFVIEYTLYLDETCDFADIVLPDVTFLERITADNFWMGTPIPCMGIHITQPVIKPMYNGRPFWDVMLEISDKVGCLQDFYKILNNFLPYAPIEIESFHSWEEVCDHICRSASKAVLGKELTLEDLKKVGFFYKPIPSELRYRPDFYNGLRIPFYFNIMLEKREELKRKLDEHNVWERVPREFLEWLLSDYKPLPEYKPCPPLIEFTENPDLLLAICYKPPTSIFSITQTNPILVEVSLRDPRWTRIQIHE